MTSGGRRRLAIAGAGLALLVAGGWQVARSDPRVRHLAVPVWSEPEQRAPPPLHLAEGPACAIAELARLPGRVTALLATGDGVVWIGLFDQGVYRWDRRREVAPRPVGALAGRERFVNALAGDGRELLVATNQGVVILGADGARRGAALAGETVEALLRPAPTWTGGILAGTARGLFRLDAGAPGGGAPLPLADPGGVPPRVTALAEVGGEIAIGTPRGLYFVPLEPAGAAAPQARPARWVPLVFGEPAAPSNVVTALAALPGGGVVAGTDDGGVALVRPDGRVRALRADDPAANLVNPGAAAPTPAGAAFGTQGGGLVFARASTPPTLARPARWPLASVSALFADGDALLAGDDRGVVLRARCAD